MGASEQQRTRDRDSRPRPLLGPGPSSRRLLGPLRFPHHVPLTSVCILRFDLCGKVNQRGIEIYGLDSTMQVVWIHVHAAHIQNVSLSPPSLPPPVHIIVTVSTSVTAPRSTTPSTNSVDVQVRLSAAHCSRRPPRRLLFLPRPTAFRRFASICFFLPKYRILNFSPYSEMS